MTDAKAERIIQNPGYVEVAPCPCNLMENACDFNCCCDKVNFILMVSIHRSFFFISCRYFKEKLSCDQLRQKSWSPRSVSCLAALKLSNFSLGTCPQYSLNVDEDVKKPNKQINKQTNKNAEQIIGKKGT